MADTEFTSLLPEVSPHVAGAPEPMVVNAIRNASIDFCERSWCWQADLDPFVLAANVQDYDLDTSMLPDGSAIAELLVGYYDGKEVHPITRAHALAEFPHWRTRTGNKPERFLAGNAGTRVSVIPIPSGNLTGSTGTSTILGPGLSFTVALKPSRAATGIPDFLYEKYLEEIAHGAIYRLMAVPHKNWSNANLALAHLKLFLDGATAARADSSRSYTRANNRNRNTGVARW